MKNIVKMLGFIAVSAMIGFTFAACDDPDAGLPALTGTVSITGNAQVGQTLTANTGSLGGNGDIIYQWKRGGTNIGTNSRTYTVLADDVGSTITVTVTRTGFSGSVISNPTLTVTNSGLPVLTGVVTITGTAQVGLTLTANTGSLEGSGTMTYQWRRETTNIGTNSNTYIVQTADAGSTITVTVTRSGNSGSVTSSPTATVVTVQPTAGLAFELIRGNTEYSVSLGTAHAAGEVVIPAIHNGLPVTMIADNAFSTAVNMTSIVLPNSITGIGAGAFSETGLISITIPSGVTSIRDNAFQGCTNLIRVTFTGTITASNFSSANPFPGDLRTRYLANDGGIGTYIRADGTINTWTGAPTGVTAETVSSSSIRVTWNSITGAVEYKIFRSTSAAGVFSEAGTQTPETTATRTFTDTGLTANTAYFYRVAAVYSAGTSPQSIVVNRTTMTGIPANVTATANSFSSITINWNAVTGATGYRVFRSTTTDGVFTSVGTPTTNTFTDTGLIESTTYYYRVSASNSNGTGEQSNSVSATTASGIPANVTATANSFSSITISWNAVTGATG